MKTKQTKRRLLTASAGMVAITALEGIACGNPVAPPIEPPKPEPTTTAVVPPPADAGAATPLDSGVAAPQKP